MLEWKNNGIKINNSELEICRTSSGQGHGQNHKNEYLVIYTLKEMSVLYFLEFIRNDELRHFHVTRTTVRPSRYFLKSSVLKTRSF